jgi:uroporphyrin-III C-methyltransferase
MKSNNVNETKFRQPEKGNGIVYLIGFGPGDPDLITVKGRKILKEADIIYYDDLIDKDFVLKFKGEKIYVGKRKGKHSKDQDEINQLLLESAKHGKNVVRLKGGDPMIFGHGGEEVDYLEKHQIKTEVIPGVSSGIAAAGLMKIPLTLRGISSMITFISGHSLNNLVIPKSGTLVFYMSVSNIKLIALRLIKEGWESETPVAVIYNASCSDQQTLFSTVNQLIYSDRELKTPSIIIVGKVVKYSRMNRQENVELFEAINKLVS